MVNPKQMNANYRKNERLLESDPTPINIGLSDDVKDYIDQHAGGGTEYTAGSGINITSENVIENTAQPDVTKQYVDTALAGKQDELTAGTGIRIQNNVIENSSPGVAYTAGTGIDIVNGEISNVLPNVQPDWNETDTTAQDYIKNKPTIPKGYEYYNSYSVNSLLNPHQTVSYALGNFISGYDYIMVVYQPHNYSLTKFFSVTNETYGFSSNNHQTSITITNCSNATYSTANLSFIAYRKHTGNTLSQMTIIGCSGVYESPSELPSKSSSDAGKVLTVNSAGTGVEWTTPASSLAMQTNITSINDLYTGDVFNGTMYNASDEERYVMSGCVVSVNTSTNTITFTGGILNRSDLGTTTIINTITVGIGELTSVFGTKWYTPSS